MTLAAELSELSAAALLSAYRDRRLSPVGVVEGSPLRLERAGAPAGALDGIPVAVKDVFPTCGWPTLRGSRAIDPAGPWEEDASAVAALRRHGAVLPGKTTTPEFGWKGVTDSPLAGVTRNPWDPARTAGGSSGGSSAALAAGMVPLALGTDGGGSIRIPSSFCGLPGIKPTYGRVPAEPDARDWTALPPPAASFLDGLEDGVRGLRVAFSPDLGFVDVEPDVAA